MIDDEKIMEMFFERSEQGIRSWTLNTEKSATTSHTTL